MQQFLPAERDGCGLAIHANLATKLNSTPIPALDGLRALSVVMVVLGHLGVPAVSAGHGVMTFFVLSGFLITWLLLREHATTSQVSLRLFYIRRALRLFPAFYCFCLVFAVVHYIYRSSWPHGPSYLSALVYVSNYYFAIAQPADGVMEHTWSLAVEEQFYLLWPLVFRRFASGLPRLARGLVMLLVLGAIYRLLLAFIVKPAPVWQFCAFDCRADQLAVGCLTAILLKQYELSAQRIVTLLSHPLLPLLTLSLIGLSAVMGKHTGATYQFTAGFSLEPILIAILLVQLVMLSDHPFWRWIAWSPIVYVGKISYGVYLYHWLVDAALLKLFPHGSLLWMAPLAMAMSVVIATASYYVIERRFLLRKEAFRYQGSQKTDVVNEHAALNSSTTGLPRS